MQVRYLTSASQRKDWKDIQKGQAGELLTNDCLLGSDESNVTRENHSVCDVRQLEENVTAMK
jgi:hypothetical protein